MGAKNKLTALKIKNVASGKYADGDGLWLNKRADGGAQWFLRFTIHGRRREMGLGSFPIVSLSEARITADKWRAVVREGKDPIKERERLSREADRSNTTLEFITHLAFEAKKAELKGDGKNGRWLSPLALHVLPKLGKVPIEEIDQRDIQSTISPIWHTKADTARKAINRLGIVIRHAAAMGLEVDIQAVDRAKLLLGKTRHTSKPMPALDWKEVPKFYVSLSSGTITELALKLLILTAVRSGSLRTARWEHFTDDTWIIPAEDMKGKKGKTAEFRVPISSEAQNVLSQAKMFEKNGYVFSGVKRGVISNMTMGNYMKDRGMNARPHGFRTSFRTWCAEATDIPREIAEVALAHSVGSKVEQAYMRSDYLERRRALMEQWAQFVTGQNSKLVRLVSKV